MEKTLKATRLTVCIFILGFVAGRAALAGDDVIVKEGTVIAATDVDAGTLKVSGGSITDSTGQISFGDENIITTGHMAVGSNATIHPANPFRLLDTYTGTLGAYTGFSQSTYHSPASNETTSIGCNFDHNWKPSGSYRISQMFGVRGITALKTFDSSADNPYANLAVCMYSGIGVEPGVGATGAPHIVSASHFKTGPTTVTGNAYITTLYAFKDSGMDAGDTNWGFYGLSGQNLLSGKLRIGSEDPPTVELDVAGDAKISGDLNVNGGVTVNGNSGVSATLTFSGGSSGDCSSITVTNGIITGYTTVP